jgi:hypothetical protein
MYKHWILALLATGAAAVAQTQVDLSTQSKNVDFSQAASTRPVKTGTVLPSSCVAGQLFYLTSAPAGQNLYGCIGANTWALEAGGASGGGAQSAGQLTDLQLTLTSGTVLTIGANCTAIAPCNVLINGVVTQFVVPATVTNSASAGLTARVYVSDASDGNSAGTLVVANSAAGGLTCSGCTVMNSTTAFPASGVPLGSWTALATPGQWDASGGADYRGWLGGGTRLIRGNGNCSITSASSGTTIACNGIVPSTRGAYTAAPPCNASIAGQFYFASPSSGLSAQCNGTAWQWYAEGDQITPPPAAAGFTVVNAVALADSNGSLTASAATGTDSNLRAGLVAARATTTYTVGYRTNNYDGSSFAACGLVLSNGTASGSKYMLWGDASNGPSEFYYASGYAGGVTTSFASTASPYVMNLGTIRWRRITVNGGNLNYYTSPDGQNWVTDSHTNTVAATFAPSFYGFGCDPRGVAQTYGAVVVSLSAQ